MKKSLITLFLAVSLLLTGLVFPVQASAEDYDAPEQQLVGQELPVLDGDEGIGKDVIYYQDVSPDYLQPSEAEAYQIMTALKSKFPHGMIFTNRHYYAWKGGVYSGGHGCAGFCFYLSDACFGSSPAVKIYDFTYEQIKVGDCLRINNDTHVVTIMEKYDDHVVVSEANLDDKVYWGRTFTRSEVMEKGTYLMTRYGNWQQYSNGGWKYVFADNKYAAGWGRIQGKWYYFSSDGYMQTGLLTIGGKKYAFDSKSGAMITGWINHTVDGVTYKMYANASGEILTGWQKIGNYWHIFGGNGYMKTGWYQEGSKWYYLDPTTGAMATGTVKIGNSNYTFNSSGVWQQSTGKNGWAKENGKWYFYTNNAKKTGWYQEGSTWYYFDATGAMVTGEYVISGKTHVFNGSGVWQGEKVIAQKNGWVKEDGKWYYYKNDVMQKGIQTIGGVKYAFDSSTGAMITGWIKHTVSGVAYKMYADNSGAIQTGWKKIDGAWYFFDGNGYRKTGWLQQGSLWYYFDADGVMVTGEYEISGKVNVFTDSGVWKGVKAAKNGWAQESGKWYYYKNDVKQTGWLQQGSTWYYLDANGVMVTGEYTIGSQVNIFSASGVWQGVKTAKNGWEQENGAWYYYKNDVMQKGIQTIGGVKYAFDSTTGKMLTGWISYTSSGVKYKMYAGNSGAIQTGFKTISGKTYYFDPDGYLQTGLLAFQNGFWFADENGVVMTNTWQKIDGEWYFFGTDGKNVTGWKKIDGAWYYFSPAGIMQTGLHEIGGKMYAFKDSGEMLTGWIVDGDGNYYYANESGVIQTGIVTVDGKMYAFTDEGIMLTGWIVDGAGNYYYADESGALLTGWQTIDGQQYYFDQNGIYRQAA